MGAVLAACCTADNKLWVDAGRSAATAERADAAGLTAVESLAALVRQADIVVAICPPAAARDVAEGVAAEDFDGIYVDANAIAPERTRQIGQLFDRFIDASVIGLPPTEPGTTRLYMSGPAALTTQVQQAWADSHFDARVVGSEIGAASALKMAYAGWTKGSTALLLTMAALAEAEDVSDALHEEWELSLPELLPRLERGSKGAAAKAWRFTGEMEEIAATLSAVDLPDGFHRAAADIYKRLAVFKDGDPNVDDVLNQLLLDDGGP